VQVSRPKKSLRKPSVSSDGEAHRLSSGGPPGVSRSPRISRSHQR
jgi:hypothetical protein